MKISYTTITFYSQLLTVLYNSYHKQLANQRRGDSVGKIVQIPNTLQISIEFSSKNVYTEQWQHALQWTNRGIKWSSLCVCVCVLHPLDLSFFFLCVSNSRMEANCSVWNSISDASLVHTPAKFHFYIIFLFSLVFMYFFPLLVKRKCSYLNWLNCYGFTKTRPGKKRKLK